MERIYDMMRAGGTVVGHVVGQATNAGIISSPSSGDLHESESQQLSESIGRVAPIVLAERFSTTLADNLIKTTSKIPWELCKIKPTLRIYTNYMINKNSYEEIHYEEDPHTFIQHLNQIHIFDNTQQMIFITHGFIHDINVYWLIEMKDALLQVQENTAVAFIGWGGGSNIGIDRYPNAVKNIEAVGCWVGNYAREIKRYKNDYILWGIGHSLGAHLIGFASKCSMRSFDRITGLDPAGPQFERESNLNKLDPTDAKFVDVIHTDGYAPTFSIQAITSPTNHFGTLIPMGTIDFYPNWGHSQPGCTLSLIGNHNSSFEYFITSILNPGHFKTNLKLVKNPTYMRITHETNEENEWVEMGYHCKGGNGNYYIDTKKEGESTRFVFP